MKLRLNQFLTKFLACATLTLTLHGTVGAQTAYIKANNTTALNLAGSYTANSGTPTVNDTIEWNNTVVGANSVGLGGNLSAAGIILSNPGGAVTVTHVAGNVLTIGASGINMSAATQNLTLMSSTNIAGDIAIGAAQTWNVASTKILQLWSNSNSQNQRLTGSSNIEVTGGGIVRMLVGDAGSTTTTSGNGNDTFSGNWTITNGSFRTLRNGSHAWGTGVIYLNGGTIGQEQGGWMWSNNIVLNTNTTSSFDDFNTSGAARTLKLMGVISGDGNVNFNDSSNRSGNDSGYILTGANTLSGTVTLGAGADIRVGGVNTANDVTTGAGTGGSLGTASVNLSSATSALTLSRSDTWTFGNTISGTGSLRIGGGVSGAGTQVVTVSGNNSFSGGTTLGAGTLKIGHASALGTGAIAINSSSAVFDNNTGGALSLSNALNLSGGSPTFTGTNDLSLAGAVSISGITAGQTRTVTVSANTLTLSNAITEGVAALGLTKAGAGTLNLSSTSSSFTGQVNLNGGTTTIAKLANTGTNSSLGAGSSTYAIRFNGGTLNYTGTGGDTTDRKLEMNASGAINNHSTTGTIAFTAANVTQTGTASARTLTLGGSYAGGANTFGAIIGDSGTGANITSLVKNGASLWTLDGANTYSGTTTISAGTLALGASGSIANTPTISVTSGGVFDVSASSFALGGSQTLNAGRTSSPATDINGTLSSGGTINPASNGTKGTLSVNGGLSLTGGTLNFDLTSGNATVGGGVNDLISATGALNLSGSTRVNVTWSGTIQPGTYTLISGASLGSGDATNLVAGVGIINGGRSNFTLDTSTTPGSLLLTVTGNPLSLKWVGDGAANEWDINTTANWNNGSGSDKFMDFDYVTFDDSSSNGSVSLGVIVQPGSMTFNNSTTNYTISGMGRIEGAGPLSKAGSASLTLATDNNYTGDTTLSAGTLMCGHDFAFGIGTLNLNGGTLSSDSATARTLANPVTVGSDVTLGDAVNSGALTLSGTVSLGGSTRQLTTPSSVTFSGILSNGGLSKAGAGTLTLGATNTYTGATNVNGGTLKLTGTSGKLASASAVTVGSGATLEYAVDAQTISNAITNNGSVVRTGGTGNNLYFSSTANTGTGSWGCNANYIGFNTVASLGSTTAINLNGGGIYFNTTGQTVPNTITVALGASGGKLNGSTGNTSTWNSKFTGAGGLEKVSGETAILAGTNDYTGTTTISAGTLRVSGTTNTTAGTISFNGGTLQIASGGSFTTTGSSSVASSSSGSLNVNAGGTLSVGSMSWSYAPGTFVVDGALNITGALTASWNATKSLTGTGTINAGGFANNNFSVTTIAVNRLNLGGNITMSNPGSITLSGTTLGAFANWSSSAPMTLAAATVNTVNTLDSVDGTTARSVTLSGALSGGGDLTKTGAGTLTLSGTSNYSGATAVNGGTLVIGSGASIGGSGVAVAATGTLSGTGTVGAAVTAAGTIAPGTGVGQLPVTGNTVLTGTLAVEVDGATGDKLMVTGDLNLTGSTILLTPVGAGFTAASYVIAECTGTLTGLPSVPTGYQVTAVGNTVVLSPAGGYNAWKTANGTAQAIDGDHDNDGVSNGVEFFVGGPNNTTGFTPLPGISGTSVTYTRHSGYTGVYGTDFVIETSETLTGAWTQETVGANVIQSGDSFTYTFPAPLGSKKFVRLKVTGPN